MQVRSDVGEGAEHEHALDETHGDDRARPRRAQDGGVVGDEAARAGGGGVARMRDRIAEEFDQKRNRCDSEKCCKKKEYLPPSEEVAEDAAGCLPEQLTENLAGQESAEHLLAAF